MRTPHLLLWSVVGLLSLLAGPLFAQNRQTVIFSPRDASWAENLAAKEVRRYIFLRTSRLFPIVRDTNSLPAGGTVILVARKDRPCLRSDATPALLAALNSLPAQSYLIRTLPNSALLLAGGDDFGVLYAAYRFAELLGVRFYLDADVIPDELVEWQLPRLNDQAAPLFPLRGIQPFHDFPEGPDWWNREDYLAVIGQLPKLRMNFFGLHTYPEGRPNAEPTVWIGLPSDIGQGGSVSFAYPSSFHNSFRGNWGYATQSTSDYLFGSAGLFPRDDFGPAVMAGFVPAPPTPEACQEVFGRTAELLAEAFTFAHKVGVKTCVGTEMPLVIPAALQQHLKAQRQTPGDLATVQSLYEGIFRRAAQAYPLDYYWLWTPERWTWQGAKEEEIRATTNDLVAALAAYQKVKPTFRLATCGWVLGPPQDRTLFDKLLPKDLPIGCLNRDVGKTRVEPGFAQVKDRSKWAIPWLEDDANLTAPQLWAGRLRRDAADALRSGCDGLMGIHWRTRVLRPNVAALAQAAWTQHPWGEDYHPQPGSNEVFAATKDFYEDWAQHEFGPQVGRAAATLFQTLDGHLPCPATWVDGPGGLQPDPRPWEQVADQYSFVSDFELLRPRVKGAGNLERFDYWLNTFRYLRGMGEVKCCWSEYLRAIQCVKAARSPEAKQEIARILALPVRQRLVQQIGLLYNCLLATVSTPGELGTLANWNQHNLPALLTAPDQQLAGLLGKPLPPETRPPSAYHGPLRLIVPTKRTSLAAGEPLTLQVIILSTQAPRAADFCWRGLGKGSFVCLPLQHLARGVYTLELPPRSDDFEYYLRVESADGQTAFFPPTAPRLNQTIVVYPAK